MPTLPSAVLFDFDGIIVDTEWVIYETWLDLYQEHGQALPLETYNQCIGSDFDTWSPETHLEELTGKSFDWPEINVARNVVIRKNLEGAPAIPGVLNALDWLGQQNIPLAVVSSSSHHWVDGWIATLSLTNRFTTTVCRGDAPRIKPAPDLYLEAARQLDLPAENCLVIEDSVNGIKSARAANMQTIAVPNRITADCDFSHAHQVITSLEELSSALR